MIGNNCVELVWVMHTISTNDLNNNKFRLVDGLTGLVLLLTVGVLLFNIPDGDLIQRYGAQTLAYLGLTGFVLFFGVWLSEGELSPAHVIGMIALLSLPEVALPLTTWAVAIGGVLGTLGLMLRQRVRGQFVRQQLTRLIFVAARVTLSFYIAAQVYVALDGMLPLTLDAVQNDAAVVFALIVYTVVYTTLYFTTFVMETYVQRRPVQRILRTNLLLITVTMLLPVPFAVLSAQTGESLSRPSQFIGILGVVVIVVGLHALSRSEAMLRRQLDEMSTLSVVSNAMRSHLQLDALLRTIYVQVSQALEIDNFVFGLTDRRGQAIEFPLMIQHGKQVNSDATNPILHSDGRAFIEHVLRSGSPLLITHNVQATAAEMSLQPPAETMHSWMGVPLKIGERTFGVMAATSYDPNHTFDRSDLRMLNILASSASVAVENAQLYRDQIDRVDQLKALNSVSALLSGTLLPETVLDTIISSATALDQSNAVAVYLRLEDEQGSLPLVRSAGLSSHFVHSPIEPLSTPNINNVDLMPLAVEDIHDEPRLSHQIHLLREENKQALVELPLTINERCLGILTMFYDEVQYFDGERLELLGTFATQAAQAIKNARTYATTDEARQRSANRLLALAEVSRNLTSTVDLNRISQLILKSAVEATGARGGLVMLYEADEPIPRIYAQQGYENDDLRREELASGVSGDVLRNGDLRLIEDFARTDGGGVPSKPSTRSQLSVPVQRGEEIIGVVTLTSDRISDFSNQDSQFVTQVADHAVIAIDNARLFARITEGRDRLQVILNTMDEAIVLINSNGEIALANFRVDMLGLEVDQLQGHKINEIAEGGFAERLGFKSDRDLARFVEDLGVPGTWKNQPPHTYVYQDNGTALYVQRYVIPVPDEQGQTMGALLVFYNKTEEYELNRTREELSRMIVHDLRSPLTAVTTSIKLLRDLVPKDSDYYSIVETTTDASRSAIRKLLARVDNLLDISKMESGKLEIETEVVELATLVDSVCIELSPLAHELEISIEAEIPDSLPLLSIDADKVERLVTNLVDNALKYSPANGHVVIQTNQNAAAPDYIRVDVIDNGPGVPDEYKENLFEQFVQVKGRQKVRRGVGLGLAFCKLVAEAHGGKIWIEDNPAGGSIFAFTLPVAPVPVDDPRFEEGNHAS